MKCEKCGSAIPVRAKFCQECGEKVQHIVYTCSRCGAQYSQPVKFCNKCGSKKLVATQAKETGSAFWIKMILAAVLGTIMIGILIAAAASCAH